MEEGMKAKKGYSIWSLLVIMTLLTVWLAIPRRCENRDALTSLVFFTLHQIAGLLLVSFFIWTVTGKRPIVLGALIGAIVVGWWPYILFLLVEPLFPGAVEIVISDWYAAFYTFLDQSFGYGLTE